jgi:hypothetical protein
VRLLGKVECFGNDFHLSAVLAREVAVQKMLERLVYHFLISLFLFKFFIGQHSISLLIYFFLAKVNKKDASTSFL